jgi:hypothetical protein
MSPGQDPVAAKLHGRTLIVTSKTLNRRADSHIELT